jgi:hypothetical protein
MYRYNRYYSNSTISPASCQIVRYIPNGTGCPGPDDLACTGVMCCRLFGMSQILGYNLCSQMPAQGSHVRLARRPPALLCLGRAVFLCGADEMRGAMSVAKRLILLVVLLVLPLLLPADRITAEEWFDYQVAGIVAGQGFNLGLWEVNALASKARDAVVNPAAGLDDSESRWLVLDYLWTAQRIAELEDAATRLLSGSDPNDTDGQIASLNEELRSLRLLRERQRPVVEAILEVQVASVLAQEGLTTAGVLWPPLKFSFSEPPLYLVVSPRREIAMRKGIHLRTDLLIAERELLEARIDKRIPDHVSLVEDIGGFGAYPTMVLDNASQSWILDTIAHEWTHNFLAFRPLGWRYFDNADTVTLNETAASIVGEEIGARVLQTYYPEQAAARRPSVSERLPQRIPELQPPPYDFNGEMRNTRVRVDELLSKGLVTEAETFMEEQRRRFVEEGYVLRKLNQAYFAFHGSYATAPSAVDPIGPKMTRLRQGASSLGDFLETVSRFTQLADLDAALATLDQP